MDKTDKSEIRRHLVGDAQGCRRLRADAIEVTGS